MLKNNAAGRIEQNLKELFETCEWFKVLATAQLPAKFREGQISLALYTLSIDSRIEMLIAIAAAFFRYGCTDRGSTGETKHLVD